MFGAQTGRGERRYRSLDPGSCDHKPNALPLSYPLLSCLGTLEALYQAENLASNDSVCQSVFVFL